jgi:ketosteroid isomerase-like protein
VFANLTPKRPETTRSNRLDSCLSGRVTYTCEHVDHRLHDGLRPLALVAVPGRHVDTIRIGYDGFNRGDLTEAREIVTQDVEWWTTGSFPGIEGVYRGPDALDAWMDAVRAEWQVFEVSLAEVLAESDDAVALVERLWGRGRESGAEVEMGVVAVYRFNPEGKLAQRKTFNSADEALAAL